MQGGEVPVVRQRRRLESRNGIIAMSRATGHRAEEGITYKTFSKEEEMAEIVALIDKDLSEPYSIFTYRYFIYNWPHHAHMAM
eukprot:768036-Hanusia_phi.AAC.6